MATTTTTDTTPTPTNSSSQATSIPSTSQNVDELNTQQQHVQHQPTIIADNVPNAMLDENTFVNPFSTTFTSVAESSSSQYMDPLNMRTFYQPYPHEYQRTKDHPVEQEVIEFDDSYKAPLEETGKGPASESSARKKGRTVAITTEDMRKRRNDRNKDDLDTMSLDDVYNHLKVYEPEVQKKSESNSQNMDFISSSNTSSGKGKVHTASVLISSTQVSTTSTDVAAASLIHDTICTYIATQSNGSQIKYEDITQIDKDDIEEMDIKWNLALLSMSADRFWRKTGKKITIQGSDVAGFNKSNVECFNCHKMGHFAREYRAPRSQDRGKREGYKQADDEVPTEFALMAKSSSSSDNEVNKEKESLDNKLTGFENALKDLDNLLGSQRSDKSKEGLRYSAVPPPPAQIYSPPKKDLSWTCLPEFVDDTVTEYRRPTPSSIMSKPMIKFVKEADCHRVIKINNTENARKSIVKYAEMHMTVNISYLSEYEPYDGGYVSFGHGGGKITGKGIIKSGKLEFENVYFVKELKYNLFSVSQICDNKNSVLFTDSECLMLGKDFKLNNDTNVLLRTLRQHNMYSIDLNNIVPHKNLTCLVAKASVDENLKVKIIKCDNGGEYKNQVMNEFCTKKGIRREFNNARTPQQNGVAERRNKTLIKATRTMLADAKLPVTFWAEAVNTACYVRNRVLVNKSQNKTPYELFNSRIPAIGFLRPFVCHIMILNTLDHLEKFDAKRDEENKLIEKGAGPNWLFDIDTLTNSMNYEPVVVAGTSSTNISGTKDVASKAMKKDVSSLRYIALPNWFYEAHMETSNDTIRNSDAQDDCNADVPKSSGISNPTATSKVLSADQVETAVSLPVESEILTVSSHVPTVCLDTSLESSSSQRLISKGVFSQKETPSLGNALTLSNKFEDTFGDTTNAVTLNKVEADLSNMETSIPEEAMQEELLQFKIHNVWVLVDCPKGVRPIGTKWVLKNKKDERDIVIRNKARLVAQGYTQEEGIYYKEVFTPVARIEAIRLFLAYASFMGFIVYQMGVKSAFLYGTIDEEVYMMQPPRFQDPEFPERVYKVKKAMYRLHQAPRAWYGTLSKYLLDNGFQRGTIDQTLFIRNHKGEFLLVQMLGQLILPWTKGNPWGKDRPGKDVELHLYGSMIRSLMYLTASRPDIMFAVCACAKHQVTPKECHIHAVKRIFRYLKGHPKLRQWYLTESPFDLVAYSNSDYGGATQDRKSTTRGSQFLGRRLILWQRKKQTIVATSTTEAEYVAAASGCG
nr:hypothetical protein [Tanacetum cinerariifolium]